MLLATYFLVGSFLISLLAGSKAVKEERGYQMLAIAVLDQAWKDARGCSPSADAVRKFLLTSSPMLRHWSDQAGLSQSWVIEQARKEFHA